MHKPLKRFSRAAQNQLLSHTWPGNVRELRNMVKRAVILETSEEIQLASLPDFHIEARLRKTDAPTMTAGQSLDDLMNQFERELILHTLEQHRYNLTRTAEHLKLSRHALRYRMQRLNLHTGEEEDSVPAGKDASPC
jgi:DNA-binding NtrC family response regulator